MDNKVRIGIIGAGGIAGAHIRAYKEMADVEVAAVADIIPGKAAQFIRRWELPASTQAFDDHRELLKLDLDGVSVCTPNIAHHETAVDALNAGLNVLCEKPMAYTLDQGVDMLRAQRRSGKILTIGFQPRYDPNMTAMRQIVQSGELGKVYYVQTGGGRRRGIPRGTFIRKDLAGSGALADIGCYSLDMALYPLNYPKPLTVTAYSSDYFGKNPKYFAESENFEVEDFGVAMIRLEGGVVLNFQISWAMHMDSFGPAIFLGTEAGLKLTPTGSGAWDGGIRSMSVYRDFLGHHTEMEIPLVGRGTNIFYEKVRAFVTAIQEDKPAPIPADQILRNQAIIDGMLRSAAEGREVTIDIPEV